jgi:hypothetical protein
MFESCRARCGVATRSADLTRAGDVGICEIEDYPIMMGPRRVSVSSLETARRFGDPDAIGVGKLTGSAGERAEKLDR